MTAPSCLLGAARPGPANQASLGGRGLMETERLARPHLCQRRETPASSAPGRMVRPGPIEDPIYDRS